ncbi:type II toxin-antitoxin system RelB/DinJ family antitoxin [Fusobacterium polymorphum]|uniref:type II toxin-antitoxin system RelB/DinJ family antitoxin n=1 Tax=Fusobacterium nucleatum subsp. polymorphum TaxID=76857 RepID=UPI0030096544
MDIKGSDKRAVINIHVNDEVKKEAETIFKSLGLNMSVAMNLFLKKCINENGIPFDLKIPNKETIEALEETNKILNEDIKRKSYKNADELFEDLGV